MGLFSESALVDALIVLALASAPSVAWFFHFRKKMLRHQSYVIKLFESIVKPRDQRYYLHGYLVGFTGEYWVNRGRVKKVYVTYTMPPYYAFFYLPVIALLRKRERLEVAVELRDSLGVRGEAHIYDPRRFDVKRLVANDVASSPVRKKLSRVKLRDIGAEAYRTPEDGAFSLALDLWSRLARLGIVHRVSVVPGKRLILALVSPSRDGHGAILKTVLEVAESAASRVEEVRS